MRVSVNASASYDLPAETFVLLMVEPPLVGLTHQVLDEKLVTTPTPYCELWTDGSTATPSAACSRRRAVSRSTSRATIEAAPIVPLTEDAVEHHAQGRPRRRDGLHPPVAILPVGPPDADGARRVRQARARRGAGPGDRRLGPPARRVPLRDDRRHDLGLRHRHRAGRASAATSPTWSSPSAGPWASPPATSRATPCGSTRPTSTASPRSTSAAPGTTSTPPPTASARPSSRSPSAATPPTSP